MKAVLRFSRYARTAAVFAAIIHAASAQIPQNKPELCGKASFVPVPSGATAGKVPGSGWTLTIMGPNGKSDIPFVPLMTMVGPDGKSEIPFVPEGPSGVTPIEQVCPLAGDKLLVFGETIPAAYLTGIVDLNTGKLTDAFESWWPPVISPDQHWLIMRAFYPERSDAPFSDEYLLYDLTKNPFGNRMPGVTMYTDDMHGRVVYPAVEGGVPFEHFNLPESEQHSTHSRSYYWASDSSAVVFADGVQDTVSIVLVRTDTDPPKTYVHALTRAEVCQQGGEGKIGEWLMLSDAEVGAARSGDRLIIARFQPTDSRTCTPQQVVLHESDFKPAPLEVHRPIIRNRTVTIIEPPVKK